MNAKKKDAERGVGDAKIDSVIDAANVEAKLG